jgi:hypothetical protein
MYLSPSRSLAFNSEMRKLGVSFTRIREVQVVLTDVMLYYSRKIKGQRLIVLVGRRKSVLRVLCDDGQ